MSFTREDGTRYKGWNLYHTGTMWEAYTYPTGEIITANTHADLRREIDTRDLFARVDAALARAESSVNLEPEPMCPVCGEFSDYCQGHGPIADVFGSDILALHDDDIHVLCYPGAGCNDGEPLTVPCSNCAETLTVSLQTWRVWGSGKSSAIHGFPPFITWDAPCCTVDGEPYGDSLEWS